MNVAFQCRNSALTANRRCYTVTKSSVPTVLILDRSGQVVLRFEGEDRQTVVAVRTQLAQLH